jgi:hypothetical protein
MLLGPGEDLKFRPLQTSKTTISYIDVTNAMPFELIRHKCKWEDNIKMYLKEIECDDVDWVHVAQDMFRWRALLITVINLSVP